MGILMMNSMGWPYDSFNCLLFIQELGTDCFSLVIMIFLNLRGDSRAPLIYCHVF